MSDFVSKFVGATNHCTEERQKEDYYATHPRETERLLKHETFSQYILEPACGEGHISKVLEKHGYNVLSLDLVDRGYGKQTNFFDIEQYNGDIVTNPPYKSAQQFVEHALEIIPMGNKVAMLLRLNFLESKKRQGLFKELRYVYVAVERMKIAKNGDFNINTGAIAYAWFIWEKGYNGEPIVRWC